MKITINILDSLLQKAEKLASKRQVTFYDFMEQGSEDFGRFYEWKTENSLVGTLT